MITPRLLLLTGPAAGEVAEVLHAWTLEAEFLTERLWDEVRDFLAAPRRLARAYIGPETSKDLASAICAIPGGEAWLVGLVLPEGRGLLGLPDGRRIDSQIGETLPARLAILAESPPPLLVERVMDWGGQRWECLTGCYRGMYCQIMDRTGPTAVWHNADTWPEAVAPALGEPGETP